MSDPADGNVLINLGMSDPANGNVLINLGMSDPADGNVLINLGMSDPADGNIHLNCLGRLHWPDKNSWPSDLVQKGEHKLCKFCHIIHQE